MAWSIRLSLNVGQSQGVAFYPLVVQTPKGRTGAGEERPARAEYDRAQVRGCVGQ